MAKKQNKYKYVNVTCESPMDSAEVYIKVDADCTEEQAREFAENFFFDWANFSYEIVDEVPEDAKAKGIEVIE